MGLIGVTVSSAESSQSYSCSLFNILSLIQVSVRFRTLVEEALFDKTRRKGVLQSARILGWSVLLGGCGRQSLDLFLIMIMVCTCVCVRERFLLWINSEKLGILSKAMNCFKSY